MSFLDIAYSVLIMPIQLIFEFFFMLAYREIGNAGLSIIALSLAMNFLVLPLYMRADKMQERERDMEAKLHAGVAHIRKTFKGDEKMMMLQTYYRQNNYRPTDVFKGSISLFLEIPFFIAAYQYLSHLSLLDGASLGIIANLGAPDGLLALGDVSINVLPFIMTAINLCSCLLFTKGMPAKTKVQLYVMAALFLILLYNSPSGLVFYWTLNNLFSLIKTLFYKLRNPKRVLTVLAAVAGVALVVLAGLATDMPDGEVRVLLIVLGLALLLPLALPQVKKRVRWRPGKGGGIRALPARRKTYVAGALFLTVLFGALIPSSVIAASPQEFYDMAASFDPIWYLVSSLSLAAGTFLVWMSVFYWLTASRFKIVFQAALWVLCGLALVDYLFFGTNLGLIGNNLQYQSGLSFSDADVAVNCAVLIAAGALLTFLFARIPRKTAPVLAVVCVALAGMAALNVGTIGSSVAEVQQQAEKHYGAEASFTLSKDGKNVVVIMLDRAMGEYVPYFINEKPELKEAFSGFTYYDNVISFGRVTNIALPALMGGYEYTPAEINKRDTELLVDKHNEALKVMPVLFDENGFDVTVLDPTFAGYRQIPDIGIYSDYEDIDTYITRGSFAGAERAQAKIKANMRNFFCFGLMKASPLFFQPLLYDKGTYNEGNASAAGATQSVSDDGLTATGLDLNFLDNYQALTSLDAMTNVTDDPQVAGSFVMLTNETTHEPMTLQEPDYTPVDSVDNTAFEAGNHDRFTLPDGQLRVENADQYRHYQINMAALLALADWLDYLKQNGVYDNTRIIIAADHGRELHQLDSVYDESYYPLLMVKDFNATEFTTSSEFMTNADVPTLATADLIADPVNPFTGKPLNNREKFAHDQYVFGSHEWDVTKNNGTTFLEAPWLAVHDDMRDASNWSKAEDPSKQDS